MPPWGRRIRVFREFVNAFCLLIVQVGRSASFYPSSVSGLGPRTLFRTGARFSPCDGAHFGQLPRIFFCLGTALPYAYGGESSIGFDGKILYLYKFFPQQQNAFGSGDPKLLALVMAWMNLPSYITSLINDAYSEAYVRLRLSGGRLSARIRVERGVFQGCPLSPTLFNLILELLIRALNTVEDKVSVSSLDPVAPQVGVNHMAYADDLGALSGNKAAMELMLQHIELFCNITGIDVNLSKTWCTVSFPATTEANSRRSCKNPRLQFEGKEIQSLKGTQTFKFLGTEVGGTGSHLAPVKRLVDIITKYGDLIEKSRFDPYIKSAIFQSNVVPKVMYTLSIWTLPTQSLMELDLLCRKYAKKFEMLRKSHNNAQIHAPKEIGGLGFLSFRLTAPAAYAVPHLRRMLTGDAQVKAFESSALVGIAEALAAAEGVTAQDLLADTTRLHSLALASGSIPLDWVTTLSVLALAKVNFSIVDAKIALTGELVNGESAFNQINAIKDFCKADTAA